MKTINTNLSIWLVCSLFAFTLSAQRTINVNTVDEIRSAMANALPGDEIIVATGTYAPGNKIKDDGTGIWSRFIAAKNGTSTNQITIRGASSSNKSVFSSPSVYNGEILLITGSYWVIKDIIIQDGKRGIITDKANNNQLIGVDVHNIGSEGIHLRNSSSNNLIRNCKVYNVGINAPGTGEGIYIGSSRNSHGTYGANCDNNIIEGCTLGPDVRAEGVDVKEGTSNTIIRNCTFSGKGISGENSADAFLDLKGIYGSVYNNVFNRDGSDIIASGIDFQEVSAPKSGYKNAIFDNTFNFGSKTSIPTARRKGGDPYEIHFWNNTRDSNSPHFPTSDPSHNRTIAAIVESCPSWNVVPCNGGPSNQAPSVSISSPSNGATFTTGDNITITASASDSDGNVTKVEFYRGSTKLGQDTSSPYNFTISNASAGTYTLTAKATDNDNASRTSASVTITVENSEPDANQAPSISITSPSNGANFTTGDNITITASASDNDGSVTKVEFYRGSTKLGEDSSSPYNYTISNASAGTYNLTAKATDDDGATRTSSTVSITVENSTSENNPPSLSFIQPSSNNITLTAGYQLLVEVGASDSDGTIANVRLSIDGNFIRQENFAPYEWGHEGRTELNNMSVGNHVISVTATDNDGASTTKTLNVTVNGSDPDPDPSGCTFGTPRSNVLPGFNRATFNNVHVLGNNGPNLSNVKKFSIDWIPSENRLKKFAVNTKDGNPSYYIDLRSKISHSFGSANPDVTISGSQVGIDGSYWVTKDGDNFVMVSKNGGYTLYFSNSSSAPSCSNKNSKFVEDVLNPLLNIYPVPALDMLYFSSEAKLDNSTLKIIDMQGKIVAQKIFNNGEKSINVSSLRSGIYFIEVQGEKMNINTKFIKQ